MAPVWRSLPWFLLAGLVAGAGVWVAELTYLFDVKATSLGIYFLVVIAAGIALGARQLPPLTWTRGAVWAVTILVGELVAFMIGMVLFFNP